MVWKFLKKTKNRGILRSSNHTPGHTFIQKRWTLFKKIHAKKKTHTCTSVLIPAPFTIAKTRKQPKCHQQTMDVRRCDVCVLCQSAQPCPTFLQPQRLQPTRLLCPWNPTGKNTGVGSHSLLQGIFPTQRWNSGLLHCRQILYHRSHQGSLGVWEDIHLHTHTHTHRIEYYSAIKRNAIVPLAAT